MNDPDYANYSLDELIDARRHIDTSRHPERTRRLDEFIEAAQASSKVRDERGRTSDDLPVSRRVIGLYLVATGIWTAARLLDAGLQVDGSGSWLVTGLVAIPIFVFGAMILGGALILLRWRIGLWISLSSAVLQIPFFAVGHVAYSVGALPILELNVWPRVGFTFSTGMVATVFVTNEPSQLYVGINCGAAFICVALVYYAHRQVAAYLRWRRLGRSAA